MSSQSDSKFDTYIVSTERAGKQVMNSLTKTGGAKTVPQSEFEQKTPYDYMAAYVKVLQVE